MKTLPAAVVFAICITYVTAGVIADPRSPECLCASDPCEVKPWCVERWPYTYRGAICVRYGCCQRAWFNSKYQDRLICPDRNCPAPGNGENCADETDECGEGNRCSNEQKCCNNGCRHVCTDPVEPECPFDLPRVLCIADPCSVNTPECKDDYPDATCVAEYCGGCNALWYETSDMQKRLNCNTGCNCPVDPCSVKPWCAVKWPHLYRGAFCMPFGCCEAAWFRSKWLRRVLTCPELQCPAVEGAGTCVDLCESDGDCTGIQRCCSNGCGHVCMDPVEPTCPPGKEEVQCFASPCAVKAPKCKEDYPDAKCVDNFCGGCHALWYETSDMLNLIKCDQECNDDSKTCPDNSLVYRNPDKDCDFDDCLVGCPEDLKLCPGGLSVVRDPENNCEFPDCPGCDEELKHCPDGSSVVRDPDNNCEFPDCPGCPEDLKHCPDGSSLVRDPDNYCKFPDCPAQGNGKGNGIGNSQGNNEGNNGNGNNGNGNNGNENNGNGNNENGNNGNGNNGNGSNGNEKGKNKKKNNKG